MGMGMGLGMGITIDDIFICYCQLNRCLLQVMSICIQVHWKKNCCYETVRKYTVYIFCKVCVFG